MSDLGPDGPRSQPDHAPQPRPALPDGACTRDLLARTWAYLLSAAAAISLRKEELERALRDQLDALCSVLTIDPFDAAAVERSARMSS
ncbi:hypothetical protein ACRAKI_13035 [Saccharothrix isguenensis]